MAQYNPNGPDVIGNEWVAIVPAAYTMDAGTERGYRFASTAGEIPTFGQFFLEAVPANNVVIQYPLLSIYASGTEDDVGEIKTVTVPVSSASVTGTTSPPTSAEIVAALASPAGGGGVTLTSNPCKMDLSFDMASVNAELTNKRILNVSIVYTASGGWANIALGGVFNSVNYRPTNDDAYYGSGKLDASGTIFAEDITSVSRLSLGEINPFAVGGYSGNGSQAYPWRNQELQRFAAGGATPMRFRVSSTTPTTTTLRIEYLALEITYCVENRLRYGSASVGNNSGTLSPPNNDYTIGDAVNNVVMRTSTTFVTGTALPVGEYALTSCIADAGDQVLPFFGLFFAEEGGKPTAQAARELYPMPNSKLRGIELDRASRVGEKFDVAETRILPYLAYSDTYNGSSLASTHAYGRVVGAPVYAGSSLTQSFLTGTVDPTPYPFIRFWARRFNVDCTNVPALTASVLTASVSITCAAFLALPEIADGWRQVTLRFPAPTVVSTSETITWSSPAATGAQWQVLVDRGSIGPGDNSSSNYATSFASPVYPPVGLRTNEDVAFYLVQDPPTVTGVTASVVTAPLSPISLDCGTPGGCIPTGMSAVSLNWTSIATSAPSATGTFGYYEVQRQDDVDATWQTIATLYTLVSTSFPDREARVGVASRYRVRMVTDYGIAGPFSSTVSATIPATDPSVWLFSSSWDLFGIFNFAAIEVGDTQPPLNLAYYEGSAVTYQEMYGRNNRVGFHGTERGGEAFTVTLLSNQGMAVPTAMGPRFANFRSLAWNRIDSVYSWTNPYVCVRNGEGDRWFASVEIPASRFDRRKPTGNHIEHLNVNVIEVLDLPVPADLGTAP
jgi:hypothetical protein